MDPRGYKDKIDERLKAWFAKNDPTGKLQKNIEFEFDGVVLSVTLKCDNLHSFPADNMERLWNYIKDLKKALPFIDMETFTYSDQRIKTVGPARERARRLQTPIYQDPADKYQNKYIARINLSGHENDLQQLIQNEKGEKQKQQIQYLEQVMRQSGIEGLTFRVEEQGIRIISKDNHSLMPFLKIALGEDNAKKELHLFNWTSEGYTVLITEFYLERLMALPPSYSESVHPGSVEHKDVKDPYQALPQMTFIQPKPVQPTVTYVDAIEKFLKNKSPIIYPEGKNYDCRLYSLLEAYIIDTDKLPKFFKDDWPKIKEFANVTEDQLSYSKLIGITSDQIRAIALHIANLGLPLRPEFVAGSSPDQPLSYGASAQQAVSAQPPAYNPGQSQPARPLSPKRPGGSGT